MLGGQLSAGVARGVNQRPFLPMREGSQPFTPSLAAPCSRWRLVWPRHRPVSNSDTCNPSELLILASAQMEAAFLPSSTCDNCEVVKSVRSDN